MQDSVQHHNASSVNEPSESNRPICRSRNRKCTS